MPKLIQDYGTLVALVISLAGGFVAIDAHYAKAVSVQRLELRMDQKILVDRQEQIQQRVWKFEDRYRTQDFRIAPIQDREQWRILLEEQRSNEKELDLIKQKSMEQK